VIIRAVDRSSPELKGYSTDGSAFGLSLHLDGEVAPGSQIEITLLLGTEELTCNGIAIRTEASKDGSSAIAVMIDKWK